MRHLYEALTFVWDERKARTNLRDHGISFEEAMAVFLDGDAVLYPDTVDEYGEERYHLVGFAQRASLLLVVHSYRTDYGDPVIRLISARRATSHERELYGGENR